MIPSCEYSERPRHAHAPDSDDSEGGIVFSDARPAVRALPDGGSGGPARRRPRGSAPRDSSTRSAACSPVSCGIRVGSRPSRRARRRARRTRARRHFFRWRSLHTATEEKSFFSFRARSRDDTPPNTPADLFFTICRLSTRSRALYDKRISAEIAGEALGEEYKGYIFKIMGGNDKQGFGMKQGVLTASRVFLLMRQNTSGFQGHGRRKGERRRKACRGCIVSPEIAVLNLMIVKQGDGPLPGLTDEEKPRMRGPKRASKVRKLFNLTKDDDVRKYVNTYRREFESATGKKKSKAPKIQRLVTANTLQRKRTERSIKKARIASKQAEETEYRKLIAIRVKEAKERRSESLAKRRASSIAKKEAA